jgi:hypothetical protein
MNIAATKPIRGKIAGGSRETIKTVKRSAARQSSPESRKNNKVSAMALDLRPSCECCDRISRPPLRLQLMGKVDYPAVSIALGGLTIQADRSLGKES